jgi:hypothetical protein
MDGAEVAAHRVVLRKALNVDGIGRDEPAQQVYYAAITKLIEAT